MKKVVSVSLGSSQRDHVVEVEILGEKFIIKRIGTDGNRAKAIKLISELDGKIDALGIGGTDLYIYAGNRRYTFRETREIVSAAKVTPVVDGSGLKNTLERRVVEYIQREKIVHLPGKRVLMVCAADRFGMAEALSTAGCEMVYGDLIFALGVPWPLRSLQSIDRLARILAPVVTQLPIHMVYPTGNQQEKSQPKYQRYYHDADIIAGDFHYIKKYMPEDLAGKVILTNTVTTTDISMLKSRGISKLITTTPELGGRSFGTNVIEGVLVALAQKRPDKMQAEDYHHLLDQIGFVPRIVENV